MSEQKEMQVVYQRPNHFASLEYFRANRDLCDVIINVENKSFPAHRVILAATINYFRKLFLNNFEVKNKETVTVKYVSAKNMEGFLSFAYTGQIYITENNAQTLMLDADYMGLEEITKECLKFLHSCLRVNNVSQIYKIAEARKVESLMKNAKKFIEKNFEIVSQREEFLYYDVVLLKDILCSHDVKADLKVIFDAVIRWIIFNFDERQIYVTELLSLARLSSLKAEIVMDYFTRNEIMMNNYGEFASEVINFYKTFNKIIYISEKKCIYAVDAEDSDNVEIYDPVSDRWDTMVTSNRSEYRQEFSCVLHKDRLYIIGGQARSSGHKKTVQVNNLETKSWNNVMPMHHERSWSGAVVLSDLIYVCGGWTYTGPSNVVERYCPETDKWETLSTMNYKRSTPAIVSIGDTIYAIGGTSAGDLQLNTVERYDPRENQWITIDSKMQEKRERCGATVLNDKIYVCGGYSDNGASCTVEVYNPKTNSWKWLASMNTPRFGALVIAKMGKIWAIGGCGENYSKLSSIEIYDPEINTWVNTGPLNKIKGYVAGGICA